MWIQFVLATPVVLWAGWPFFVRGWASVRNRSLNMFSLIALGVGAAYLYSLVATLRAGAVSGRACSSDGVVPVYYEAAAVITVLVLLGQVLELRAREQTGGAIRALLESRAEDGAAHPRAMAATKKCRSDAGADRRPAARAPRRQRPGRRRRHRGPQRGRRIDGDRRIDAGREGARTPR